MTKGAPVVTKTQSTAAAAATNGFAIASFVTALMGIVVLGLVFGYIALGQIKENKQEGRGFAVAGIVISYVYLGMIVLGMIFMMLFFGLFASLFARPFVSEIPNIINAVDTLDTEDSSQLPTPSELRSLAYDQSETIESGDKSIRLTEVKPYTPTNIVYAPAEGMRLIAIKIEERNVSSEPTKYQPTWYELFTYDTGFSQEITDIKPELLGGLLEPEQRIAGYIVFEVPKDVVSEDLYLSYSPTPSSGSYEAVWRLK